MEIQGKYSIAKAFTDEIEYGAVEQITNLLNQEFIKDLKVRIMPDVHQGVGCVIGFTAQMGDKLIPNIVGVDIGCGMLTVKLGEIDLDLPRLDEIIRSSVPYGRNVHDGRKNHFDGIDKLYCYRELKDTKRIEKSIGTLGDNELYGSEMVSGISWTKM